MRGWTLASVIVSIISVGGPPAGSAQDSGRGAMRTSDGPPLVVRPGMLAAQIRELAGRVVRVPQARVVGVFNPRAFLVDTSMRLPPIAGNRARVLVLLERGQLSVAPEMLVSSTVVVIGVARTLLGMQVGREVPWPSPLDAKTVERLEIRAGILATSVQTAEGVELAVSTH